MKPTTETNCPVELLQRLNEFHDNKLDTSTTNKKLKPIEEINTVIGLPISSTLKNLQHTLPRISLGELYKSSKLRYIGLYFTLNGCIPCLKLTPYLSTLYNMINAQEKIFEIVTISTDVNSTSFQEKYENVPWYILYPEDVSSVNTLYDRFSINQFPTLLLFNLETGGFIHDSAHEVITDYIQQQQEITSDDTRVVSIEPTFVQSFPWCSSLTFLPIPIDEEMKIIEQARMDFISSTSHPPIHLTRELLSTSDTKNGELKSGPAIGVTDFADLTTPSSPASTRSLHNIYTTTSSLYSDMRHSIESSTQSLQMNLLTLVANISTTPFNSNVTPSTFQIENVISFLAKIDQNVTQSSPTYDSTFQNLMPSIHSNSGGDISSMGDVHDEQTSTSNKNVKESQHLFEPTSFIFLEHNSAIDLQLKTTILHRGDTGAGLIHQHFYAMIGLYDSETKTSYICILECIIIIDSSTDVQLSYKVDMKTISPIVGHRILQLEELSNGVICILTEDNFTRFYKYYNQSSTNESLVTTSSNIEGTLQVISVIPPPFKHRTPKLCVASNQSLFTRKQQMVLEQSKDKKYSHPIVAINNSKNGARDEEIDADISINSHEKSVGIKRSNTDSIGEEEVTDVTERPTQKDVEFEIICDGDACKRVRRSVKPSSEATVYTIPATQAAQATYAISDNTTNNTTTNTDISTQQGQLFSKTAREWAINEHYGHQQVNEGKFYNYIIMWSGHSCSIFKFEELKHSSTDVNIEMSESENNMNDNEPITSSTYECSLVVNIPRTFTSPIELCASHPLGFIALTQDLKISLMSIDLVELAHLTPQLTQQYSIKNSKNQLPSSSYTLFSLPNGDIVRSIPTADGTLSELHCYGIDSQFYLDQSSTQTTQAQLSQNQIKNIGPLKWKVIHPTSMKAYPIIAPFSPLDNIMTVCNDRILRVLSTCPKSWLQSQTTKQKLAKFMTLRQTNKV